MDGYTRGNEVATEASRSECNGAGVSTLLRKPMEFEADPPVEGHLTNEGRGESRALPSGSRPSVGGGYVTGTSRTGLWRGLRAPELTPDLPSRVGLSWAGSCTFNLTAMTLPTGSCSSRRSRNRSRLRRIGVVGLPSGVAGLWGRVPSALARKAWLERHPRFGGGDSPDGHLSRPLGRLSLNRRRFPSPRASTDR